MRDPITGQFLPQDPVTRFWSHVEKTEGCWYWTAAIQQGYGVFSPKRNRSKKAHVYSWELQNGPKPKGLQLDHKCKNKACVRPSHLELTTSSVNNARKSRKYRCKNGHLKTPDNTYVTPSGVRACRECKNRAWRDMYERKTK